MKNDDNNNDDTLLDMPERRDPEDEVDYPEAPGRGRYDLNNTPTTLFAIPKSNTTVDPDQRKTDGVPVVTEVGITTERDLITNRFEILERIGAGAMAEVYRARDTMLSGPQGSLEVALKVFAHDNPWGDQAEDRIKSEVALGRLVVSPHVAQIYDLTKFPDGRWAISQELVLGKTLTQLMRDGLETDWHRITGWLIDIAKGLQAAHEVDVVHRDLKPENIMICCGNDRPKILDFGVAKLFGRDQVSLTKHGNVVGTLLYMAPEQLRRGPPDPRSDIFALGLTTVRLTSGIVPLSGDGSAEEILLARVEEPEPFRYLDVAKHAPPQFAEIVDRMLKHHPRDRIQTGADLATALQDFLDFGSAKTQLTVVSDLFPDTKPLTVPPKPPPPPPPSSGSVRIRRASSNEVSILPAPYVPREATPVPEEPTTRLLPWVAIVFAVLILTFLILLGAIAKSAEGAELFERSIPAAIQKPENNPRQGRG